MIDLRLALYQNSCEARFAMPIRLDPTDTTPNAVRDTPVEMAIADLNDAEVHYPDVAVAFNRFVPNDPSVSGPFALVALNGGAQVTEPAERFVLPGDVYPLPDANTDTCHDITACDLDEDSDIDIAIVGTTHQVDPPSYLRARVWILWNDGTGSFPEITDYTLLEGARPHGYQIACCDLDQDGDNDLAIGFDTDGDQIYLRVFLNNGAFDPGEGHEAGQRFDFSASDDHPAAQTHWPVTDLLCENMNGDDLPDLATSADLFALRQVAVFLNAFEQGVSGPVPDEPSGVYEVGDAPQDLAAADMNTDGFLDLLSGNDQDPASVLINDGGGVFSDATPRDTAVSIRPVDIATGDVDGDGCQDAVLIGDGIANCAPDPFPPQPSIELEVSVLPGDCTGHLAQRVVPDDPDVLYRQPRDTDCGDFDGDQWPDLTATMYDETNTYVLLQGQDAAFGISFQAGRGPPYDDFDWDEKGVATAVGDFDGQDHDDLAVLFYDDVNTHGVMRVLLNSGTGDDFEAGDEFEFGTLPSSIEAADLDNTNGPDLAVTDFQEDGRVWLLYNNGDGTFGEPEELDISAATAGWDVFPADLVLDDLNGDGSNDIAVVNQLANTVAWNLNEPGVGFVASGWQFQFIGAVGSLQPLGLTSADLNGDGPPDLATCDFESRSVTVVLNQPDEPGTFGSPIRYLVGQSPTGITACDYNADCLIDLATVDSTDRTISVLLNGGSRPGLFYGGRVWLPGGCNPLAITSCDLDLNGRCDLINTIQVGAHNGFLRLTYNTCQCNVDPPSEPIKGDVDGDGMVNGCDIQPFVDLYFDASDLTFSTAPDCDEFFAADMDDDGDLTPADVFCFVRTLLDLPCDVCEEEGAGASAPEGGDGPSSSEQYDSTDGSSSNLDPATLAAVTNVQEWLVANPRSAYPELSEQQYINLLVSVMVDAGLIDPPAQED